MRATVWPALLALGILLPWLSPLEPRWFWPILLGPFLLGKSTRFYTTAILLGLAASLVEVQQLQTTQIPVRPGGFDLLLEGLVASTPRREGSASRFDFRVSSTTAAETVLPVELRPRKLRVSWYQDAPELVQGQELTLIVRVQAPRGLGNPGLFDYGSWLISRGYDGSGYVRELRRMGETPGSGPVQQWRRQIEAWIEAQPYLKNADVLLALGIGEQGQMSDFRWRQLEQWGLIHLMVISGLHIGFAAGLGHWLAMPAGRAAVLAGLPGVARDWSLVGGLVFACLYALLAGFSLPTQRALAAVVAWAVLVWCRWRIAPLTLFVWVLALVLLANPRMAIQPGLWMSFGAVAVLIFAMEGSRLSGFLALLQIQGALLLVFSPLLLLLEKPVYPLGALYNLVAVPLVGLLLVPALLLGLLLQAWSEEFAGFLIYLVDQGLSWLFDLLATLSPENPMQIQPGVPSLAQKTALLAAGLAIILLRRFALLLPFALLILGLFRPTASEVEALTINVFDVGQGTAILVRQPGYALLYDSGPSYPSGFDTGEDIIVPWLQNRNITLDMILISHDDLDHIGGYRAIASAMRPAITLGGPGTVMDPDARVCMAGQSWGWGEVQYHILHPFAESSGTDNNLSCVLLIEWRGSRILLTGDIELEAERALMRRLPDPVDWLLVPHHGSRTSSSGPFVEHFQPALAVITSGWGHFYGHPVAEVLQRYADAGSQLESTATAGMLEFRWNPAGELTQVIGYRQSTLLWWMNPGGDYSCSVENGCGRRYDK